MSVIAHNIIAIILICVSKGRGRARGPVVPCVVGCPSPPRPCGSLCVFHVLWVIAPAPPRLLRQEAWWEGGGIPWGTSTVTWMTCACLLSAGGGGGAYHAGGGGGRPATRRRGTISAYSESQAKGTCWGFFMLHKPCQSHHSRFPPKHTPSGQPGSSSCTAGE